MSVDPVYTPPAQITAELRQHGYAVLSGQGVSELAGCSLAQLQALLPYWNELPPDKFLKDGGRNRRRRNSCFVANGTDLQQTPHRAHWQPVEYNALHGGMHRWFEPIESGVLEQPAWRGLLLAMVRVASELKGPQPWYIEAHQFRIDTEGGIGRPTPEGAHRDGVDMVGVFLLSRENIKGGETRVFQADSPEGQRFTLTEPWSLLLLDDTRVIHETTPIQPVSGAGHRDTLVLTLRAGGFQGD